jgi:hypothetical protein
MEINYSLKIIKERKEFFPNSLITNPIISSKNKIFEIQAGNGYGKTFLLNLIALSLKGNELKETKDTIKNSLKETISRYDNSEYYNLDYEIKFDLPDGKVLVSSQKNSDEKTVFIKESNSSNDGTNFGASLLHKDLTILYDVPSDPAERLNGVLSNLTIWNDKIFNRVQNQLETLRELERNTSFTRNENKVIEFKKKMEEFRLAKEKFEKDKITKQGLLEKLIIISNLKLLVEELRNNETLASNQKFDLDRLSKIKKPIKVAIKDESKLKLSLEKKSSLTNDLKLLILNVFKIIEYPEVNKNVYENAKLKDSLEVQNLDFNKIAEFDVQEINSLKQKIQKLTSEVQHLLELEKKNPQNKLVDDYKVFAEFLETINSDIFSEIFKTPKNDILKLVKDKLELIKPKKSFDSDIQFLKTSNEKCSGLLGDLFKIQKDIKDEQKKSTRVESTDNEYAEAEDKFNTSKEKFQSSNNRIMKLKSTLDSLKVSEYHLKSKESVGAFLSIFQSDPLIRPLAMNLESSINELKQKIQYCEEQETSSLDNFKAFEYRLEGEQKKSPEILNEFQKLKLKELLRMFGALKMMLSRYDELSKIAKNKISNYGNNADDLIGRNFFSIAGKIIAKSMDNKIIRSDGNFEPFISVDLLKKEYILEDGRIVKQEDIANGLASGNYLKQRILNLEGKYVVILLDEIGNMDSGVLREVIGAIKVIEKQNRLVLAILAQPGDDGVKINSY